MNDTLSAFWYRPFWQQIIPVFIIILSCLIGSYFFYWRGAEDHLDELKRENNGLTLNIRQDAKFIHQSSSLAELAQQIALLVPYVEFTHDPQTFISNLQTRVAQSDVTLNQLKPTNTDKHSAPMYHLEIEGRFSPIYYFIQSIISHPSANTWQISDLKISPKGGNLVAIFSISFINYHSIIKDSSLIKDESNNEH